MYETVTGSDEDYRARYPAKGKLFHHARIHVRDIPLIVYTFIKNPRA